MFNPRQRRSPFGSLRGKAHIAALSVVICLLAAMNALPTFAGNPECIACAGASRGAELHAPVSGGPGAIAYVQRSTYDIHVISPDGTGDRVLWTAPQPLSPYPAYDLAWRPDGRELAFSSEHEEACSLYESDVYAIGYDGSGYRRVTNSPACAVLAGLPKGSVEVDVTNGAGSLAEVYVQGAPGARFAENGRMRFDNVADLGAGVLQPAGGMYLGPRGEERVLGYPPYADVQPGQTVFGGSLTIPGAGALMFGAGKVSWNADGSALAYGMRSFSGIKQIPAVPPYGSTGQPLPVVQHAVPTLVAWSPSAAHSDVYLYASKDDAIYLDVAGIYLNTVADPSGGTLLAPINAYYGAEEVYDIEWLPDASGFLFTKRTINLGTFTNIFEYNFATQEITQLTNLPDDQSARGLSISPDGQQIVFERVMEAWDPTSSLWIVNRDGSGLHKLADDAGRPAWGQVPSSSPPTATPTATASHTPTVKATATASPTPSVTRVAGERRVYLPLVLSSAPAAPEAPPAITPTHTPAPAATATATTTAAPPNDGIHGRVTCKGAAAPGIELQLRFYDGSKTTTAATTATDSEGRYRFRGVAGLAGGQEYWVRFLSPNNPSWVSFWLAPSITAYSSGSTIAGGDFDIAGVDLLSPPPGAVEFLPVTFTWQRRGNPGDTYRVVFMDLDTDDTWYTPDLGNVGSFTAASLWEEAVFGKPYGWLISVFDGPDSYGQSYYYQTVGFLPGAAASAAALQGWQIGEKLRESGRMGAKP